MPSVCLVLVLEKLAVRTTLHICKGLGRRADGAVVRREVAIWATAPLTIRRRRGRTLRHAIRLVLGYRWSVLLLKVSPLACCKNPQRLTW